MARAQEQPMRKRSFALLSSGSLILAAVVAAGTPGCGGSKTSDSTSACLSCAMNACPSQAAACDASSGCKALRACSLACRSGDSACRNACVAAVAGDSTAVVAGANYLACAQAACPNECSGSTATGTAGTSGGAGGMSGAGGQGGATGMGGAGGVGGTCAAADAKLASCNTRRTSSCVETDVETQCFNKCVLNNS